MNFALFLAKNMHLSFSPLEGRWVHTFCCQKRCALRNSSRSSFCFCQMAWQGIEAPKQTIEFPAAPSFFSSNKWIKLTPKTTGNRKRDCAWVCARRINTTSENLQIEKHKSGGRSFRSPDWFVLFDLQVFWGGVYPPSATSRTISFSISNSFWYWFISYKAKKKKIKNITPQKPKFTVKSCIEAALDHKPHSNNSHTFSKLKLHKRGTRTKLQLESLQLFACQNVCLHFKQFCYTRNSKLHFHCTCARLKTLHIICPRIKAALD